MERSGKRERVRERERGGDWRRSRRSENEGKERTEMSRSLDKQINRSVLPRSLSTFFPSHGYKSVFATFCLFVSLSI